MYNVYDKINADLFKNIFKGGKATTDNFIFRLHYRLSIFLLLLAILFYSLIVYKIKTINCIFPHKTKFSDEDTKNAYCWAINLYTLPENPDNLREFIDKLPN